MKKIVIGIGIVFIVLITIFLASLTRIPSHNRNWELGHNQLPQIQINDNNIIVKNLRDFTWSVDGSADGKYITDTFNFDKMNSLDVVISHFEGFEGIAHIFITFGFEDGKHIVVSVETRRESDEEFSTIQGLLNKFELIYVVGTERDIIGTRTNVRGERVYLYKVNADSQTIKKLFVLIVQDVNNIYDSPIFYNTLSHNCTNAITRHAEDVADIDFPSSYKMLLPGYVDEVLYDMGIIEHKGTLEETRKQAQIDNEKVDYLADDYSEQIRSNFIE